ncbi:hypothetical protein BDZ94DRAFT_1269950 [Collybia nuda]|uniref:GYF domain-containing protein n=1 Tax=Collybia nuda TaxID=64659 RepID=A0A9P5XZZ6_9AGAR|nr:hypothetical protein BDZ94DRAFT_1269950 [Collybia nuda]
MSTTTMHFGPEWMRTKHQTSSRPQQPPSPPPSGVSVSGASTYSALVSPAPLVQPERRDEAHPFRYSKEDLLRIYKEGSGKGGLGLEVERWEGVVREAGSEPVGLRDMSDSEKKLFAGPLNSDLRRRQSTDYLSPLSTQSLGTDRTRLNHNSPASGTSSPLRERFGALRRRDSNTDQPTLTIPRKQSLSSLQPPLMSPRDIALPSPRTRVGYTPNFDGVLNNGESWVARRRASEASLKSSAGASRDPGDQVIDSKAPEIQEEEEESSLTSRKGNRDESGSLSGGSAFKSDGAAFQDNLNIGADMSHSYNQPVYEQMSNGPPPGIPDLASIEWSYKDPQGQIQGPFRADLMQKWFDEGYFTPDLPMKRTHLDTQWTSVEELILRSGRGKMFMTLPAPVLPPGLSNRTESPNFVPDQHLFNGPYQPAPLRNLRSSTLDSFGSNPSDSPSSSLGAGRFGDTSPDPNAFGGRGYYGDPSGGGRVASFTALPDPASAFAGRRVFNEAPMDTAGGMRGPAGYGNTGNRGPIDNYSFNRAYSPGQGTWNAPHSGFDTPNINRNSADPTYAPHFSSIPTDSFSNLHRSQDSVFGETSYQPPVDYNSYNGLNGGSPALTQHYSHSPTIQFPTQQLQQPPPPSSTYGQHGIISDTMTNNSQPIDQIPHLGSTPSPSLWNNQLSTTRRSGPFEVSHPTAANTIIAQPSVDASPWGRTSQPSRPESRVNESSSPWATSQSANEEIWNEEPGPSSLTFSNVGQHNQQQQQLSPIDRTANVVDVLDEPSSPAAEPSPIVHPDVAPKVTITPQAKSKVKNTTQANQAVAPKPTPPVPASPVVTDPSSTLVAPKPAWAIEDEVKKSKPSGVSISLREIQEAEVKKSEARKAAEREKERVARNAAPTGDVKDDTQPFIASWGLPTSQAGSRGSAPTPKETATPLNSGTPPVWTTAAKTSTAKKTMKEIQEEEERRKKTATKEITTVAARRAYAETTTKAATPPVQGSAWTTVGPSGKTTTAPAPARPMVTPSTSTTSVSGSARVNGSAAGVRPISASPTVKATSVPSHPRVDDPVSPSHDFLKWLSEALKGLNSSVNVEEIMSMLLSFPMDPDLSTVELISELIYASSTTLDGRRFAAEFISKRKTDALSRPKGTGAAGRATAKPISIADVVKATPKPAQPEWGFKVVNKKKKGGRA